MYAYLAEHERLLVEHRVDRVARHHLRLELLADRVGRHAVHLDLDVHAHLLLAQELAAEHLHAARGRDHAVHRRLRERVERAVRPPHEVRLQHQSISSQSQYSHLSQTATSNENRSVHYKLQHMVL